MLRRRNYRDWFDTTHDSRVVLDRLRELEVNEKWDNPDYRVWYETEGGDVRQAERVTEENYIHEALQEVLGSKIGTIEQAIRIYQREKRAKARTPFANTDCRGFGVMKIRHEDKRKYVD